MNPEQNVLYRGVSRIAWSYLFAFFNLNLGSLNILPDWMAFALIYGALDLLAEEERDLPLLKPFCILLGLWEGAGWLAQLFGLTLSLYPLDLLFAALSLYFYFQLLTNLAYLAALIAVNLAVMNLLPLPALDGGRVFFLLLNGVLYALFRKKIDAKYEGYVHLAGLAALMVLMLVVTLSDVGKLFGL